MRTWSYRERERGSVSAGIALVGRIDYFPDPPAVTTIDSLRTRSVGGDASSIINRIVREWAESRGPVTRRINREALVDELIDVQKRGDVMSR
jgi:hypothetical protein